MNKSTLGLALLLSGLGSIAGPLTAQDTAKPRRKPKEPPRVATAEVDFALDLYKALAAQATKGDKDTNAVVGTISLHTSLAMTAAGATGETREQLDRLLRLSEDFTAADWKAFRTALQPRELPVFRSETTRPSFRFQEANQVFGQVGIEWREDYQATLRDHFRAKVVDIDFRDPETARQRINSWVAEHTLNRIDNLIGQGALTPDMRMALVNACTFRATWDDKFSKRATEEREFTTSTGEKVKVPMMRQVLHTSTGRLDDATVLDLAFEGRDTSLLIVMPDSHDGLPALEATLNGRTYAEAIASLQHISVELELPKLELGTKADVRDLLASMGAQRAFTDKAQFGEIADGPLQIGSVLHEAQLTLDEDGVEAVAATAVMLRAGAAFESNPPRPVSIDRPFWFAVRHRKSGTILFTGRVVDPSAVNG